MSSALFSVLRRKVAWSLARWFWTFGLNRLGDHFEDVAMCGKRWFG